MLSLLFSLFRQVRQCQRLGLHQRRRRSAIHPGAVGSGIVVSKLVLADEVAGVSDVGGKKINYALSTELRNLKGF